jgi:hypothetical protein
VSEMGRSGRKSRCCCDNGLQELAVLRQKRVQSWLERRAGVVQSSRGAELAGATGSSTLEARGAGAVQCLLPTCAKNLVNVKRRRLTVLCPRRRWRRMLSPVNSTIPRVHPLTKRADYGTHSKTLPRAALSNNDLAYLSQALQIFGLLLLLLHNGEADLQLILRWQLNYCRRVGALVLFKPHGVP